MWIIPTIVSFKEKFFNNNDDDDNKNEFSTLEIVRF